MDNSKQRTNGMAEVVRNGTEPTERTCRVSNRVADQEIFLYDQSTAALLFTYSRGKVLKILCQSI